MDQQALMNQLAADPAFQKASKADQVRMAMDALSNAPKAETQEQPEAVPPSDPSGSGRSFDMTDPGDLAMSLGEGAVQAGGAALARKAVSRALIAQPHPVGKAIGVGLEFLGGLAGSSAAGAGAAGARAAATGEDVQDAAMRGAGEGAVGELGGRVLESGLKGIKSLVAGKGLTKESETDLANAQSHGIQLRPAEVSGSSASAQIEQYARRSIIGAEKFSAQDAKNSARLKSWADDLAKEHFDGLKDPAAVGAEIQKVLQGQSLPEMKRQTSLMYAAIDPNKTVSVYSKPVLDKLLLLKAQVDKDLAPQAALIIDKAIGKLATTDAKGKLTPKGVSFQEADDLRSMLLQVKRDHTQVLSDRVGGIASEIANGSLYDAMETAARKGGPDVYTRWVKARDMAKTTHEIMDHSAILQAVKSSPEDVLNVAFKGNQVTETNKIIDALRFAKDDGKSLRDYRAGAMQKMLTDASQDGILDPQRLALVANKKYSPEVLDATFGKKFMGEFQDLLNVAKRVNSSMKKSVAGNPSETARGTQNALELMLSGGAIGGVLMGNPSGMVALGAVTLATDQLARVMNSPRGIQMLKRSMVLKPGSAEAAKLVPRIMSVALGETAFGQSE